MTPEPGYAEHKAAILGALDAISASLHAAFTASECGYMPDTRLAAVHHYLNLLRHGVGSIFDDYECEYGGQTCL